MIIAVSYVDYLKALADRITKSRDREKTRLLLLISAARFLETGNYAEMSVRDVVQGAKTSHGAFYLYFTDKQALIVQLLSSFLDFEMQTLPAYDPSQEPFQIRLLFMNWYHETFRVNVGLMRCLALLSDSVPDVAAIWRRRGKELVGRALQYYRDRYDLAPEELELLRIAHHALGSMADHSLFARYGVHGASETSEARDERLLVELHAILSYRGLFGEDPPDMGLKTAQRMSEIRVKLKRPKAVASAAPSAPEKPARSRRGARAPRA